MGNIFREAFGQSVDIDDLKDIVPSPAAKAVLKKWYENQRAQFGVSTELDFRDARLRDGEVDRRLRHRRGTVAVILPIKHSH